MKKNILLFTILTLTTMSSCKKDEKEINMIDNIEEGIIGTWRSEIKGSIPNEMGGKDDYKQIFDRTFNSDSTYSTHSEFIIDGDIDINNTSGIYEVDNNNNKIYCHPEIGIDYDFELIKLTDKEFVSGTVHYKKIK